MKHLISITFSLEQFLIIERALFDAEKWSSIKGYMFCLFCSLNQPRASYDLCSQNQSYCVPLGNHFKVIIAIFLLHSLDTVCRQHIKLGMLKLILTCTPSCRRRGKVSQWALRRGFRRVGPLTLSRTLCTRFCPIYLPFLHRLCRLSKYSRQTRGFGSSGIHTICYMCTFNKVLPWFHACVNYIQVLYSPGLIVCKSLCMCVPLGQWNSYPIL